MKKDNSLTVTKEQKDEMIAEIKQYFLHERGEELGDLAAGLIFDFIREKLAPEFYNQGVSDAHTCMLEASEDLLSIRK